MITDKATICGILAIVIWSTIVGLIKSITISFGAVFGSFMLYLIGACTLFAFNGVPKISTFPKSYLFGCGALFVLYEILFSQAIGMTTNNIQAMEIGLINYLWPVLTVVFSIFINKQKVSFLIIPAIFLTISGMFLAVTGESSINGFLKNISTNPISYIFIFLAAFSWGIYCNLSKKYGTGKNAVPLFFSVVAAILGVNFTFGNDNVISYASIYPYIELLLGGMLFGISYFLWEIGIQKGDLRKIVILSYFIPVFSSLFASYKLSVDPPMIFWYGTIYVTVGSLLSWFATKEK